MDERERFKVGDQIITRQFPGVVREITEVRPTGYEWKYPDMGEICVSVQRNSFASEWSNDEFLGWWELRPTAR